MTTGIFYGWLRKRTELSCRMTTTVTSCRRIRNTAESSRNESLCTRSSTIVSCRLKILSVAMDRSWTASFANLCLRQLSEREWILRWLERQPRRAPTERSALMETSASTTIRNEAISRKRPSQSDWPSTLSVRCRKSRPAQPPTLDGTRL